MRKDDKKRASHKLTRQTYSLTHKRNAGLVPGVIAAVCAVAALAASGFALKRSHEDVGKLDALCAPPASEQQLRDQLAHAQLALEQEAATRAALQQRVSDTTKQLERAQTDLVFLQKQRKSD